MEKKYLLYLFLLPSLLLWKPGFAQQGEVQWLDFEQLEDSLQISPKKVLVYFYADWCGPCVKMERSTFKNKEVVQLLKERYHAVKMDVESTDTIHFGKRTYRNNNRKKRNPVHEIPLLLASRKDSPFTLPALVLFDENFVATARYFQFLDAAGMAGILKNPKPAANIQE